MQLGCFEGDKSSSTFRTVPFRDVKSEILLKVVLGFSTLVTLCYGGFTRMLHLEKICLIY